MGDRPHVTPEVAPVPPATDRHHPSRTPGALPAVVLLAGARPTLAEQAAIRPPLPARVHLVERMTHRTMRLCGVRRVATPFRPVLRRSHQPQVRRILASSVRTGAPMEADSRVVAYVVEHETVGDRAVSERPPVAVRQNADRGTEPAVSLRGDLGEPRPTFVVSPSPDFQPVPIGDAQVAADKGLGRPASPHPVVVGLAHASPGCWSGAVVDGTGHGTHYTASRATGGR